jgi:hypothetical protein
MGELQRQSGVEGCDTDPPGTATSGYPTSGLVRVSSFYAELPQKINLPSVTYEQNCEEKQLFMCLINTFLWIHNILVPIRIRGCVQLIYGSCSFGQ